MSGEQDDGLDPLFGSRSDQMASAGRGGGGALDNLFSSGDGTHSGYVDGHGGGDFLSLSGPYTGSGGDMNTNLPWPSPQSYQGFIPPSPHHGGVGRSTGRPVGPVSHQWYGGFWSGGPHEVDEGSSRGAALHPRRRLGLGAVENSGGHVAMAPNGPDFGAPPVSPMPCGSRGSDGPPSRGRGGRGRPRAPTAAPPDAISNTHQYERATWSEENTQVFYDLWTDLIDKGPCVDGVMTKKCWLELETRFAEATLMHHSTTQFASKRDNLKKIWLFIKNKLSKGTGNGYMEDGTITAPEHWWAQHTSSPKEWLVLRKP